MPDLHSKDIEAVLNAALLDTRADERLGLLCSLTTMPSVLDERDDADEVG